MLMLLTDAHISPDVAAQVKSKRPEIVIHSLQEWREGALLRAEDHAILTAAMEEGLSFVTYDQRTVSPLITQWAATGRDHAGVIFIDDRSIAQGDVGGKVRALLALWLQGGTMEWTNIVTYLRPAP